MATTGVNQRLIQVVRTFASFGFEALLNQVGLGDLLSRFQHKKKHGPGDSGPANFRRALEKLGPFWIKIGQMMATRPDIMPDPYINELEKLQDRVVVQPFSEMGEVLSRNLSGDPTLFFREIDVEPLGTASLAQVYGAILKDGQEVVIKVQRPGAKERIELDMAVFERVAGFVAKRAPEFAELIDMEAMLSNVFGSMKAETDFTEEADHMEDFSKVIEGDDEFNRIVIPKVHHEFTTSQILTMERVKGRSVRFMNGEEVSEQDRVEMAAQVTRFMLKQFMVEGYFHADPHPGNVFYTADNKVAMIDWGMVGKIDVRLMENIIRLLLNVYLNDGLGVATTFMEMGNPTKQANKAKFISDCQRFVPTVATADFDKLNFGATLSQLMGFAFKNNIAAPPAVAMMGKSFGNMDGTVRCITGAVSPVDIFIDYFPKIALYHAKRWSSKESLGRFLIDFGLGSSRLPEQVRLILDQVANDKMKLLLEPVGYEVFLRRFEKSIYKSYRFLGVCILIAALILAYSLSTTFGPSQKRDPIASESSVVSVSP
jgi:ubiquinone biosynthesis protein